MDLLRMIDVVAALFAVVLVLAFIFRVTDCRCARSQRLSAVVAAAVIAWLTVRLLFGGTL